MYFVQKKGYTIVLKHISIYHSYFYSPIVWNNEKVLKMHHNHQHHQNLSAKVTNP